MYNIKLLNKISKVGLSKLDADKYICSEDVQNPDGILVRSADLNSAEFNKELLCIARAGAGVNNIPVAKCAEEGIVVFNTPGANANAVKELVIAAMLLGSRRISDGIAWAKTLTGDDVAKQVEKGKSAFAGPEIYGKRLGVIGLGAIGVMVANASSRLGMDVYGYDPYLSVDAAWGLSRSVHHVTDLKAIYENCDYITIHVPANDETRGMINAESIASMKNGVRIINLARGELVNEADIIRALSMGAVGRYVTDFPTPAIIACENAIALPHLGASTAESEENCAEMAATELKNYIESGIIRNSVNYPNMDVAREGEHRICVLHKNITKMVSGISGIFSEADVNIENLLNRSKKDFACTLVDVNTEPTSELLAKLAAIDGVKRVRVI